MSGPLLTPGPGFWGKLPAAGDFVARRLPPAWTESWDRWVSRHLALRLAPDDLLCFATGAMTGVVVASRDRAGRRFPLTLAAPLAGIAPPPWYGALADLARAAAAGKLDGTALEARLASLDPPLPEIAAPGLRLWLPGSRPRVADPDAPGPVLAALLGVRPPAPSEAG